MAQQPETCAACGALVEPAQDYCLECGSRVVPGRRPSAAGRAWEQRFGRYPGDWLWASLLLLLVAAGSATAGIVASHDGGPAGEGKTVVAISPVVTAPPAPPAVTTRPASTPKPTTAPAPTPKPKPAKTITAWPARDGYTVVLASIPARGSGLDEARAKAKAALTAGLRDVGVITSARFASLHPGYYVVFAGVYRSLEDAQTATGRVSKRYPNAYARQISR